MSDAIAKFSARLPKDLYEEIRASAEANGRSMNNEIIHRLKLRHPLREATSLTLRIESKDASAALERMLTDLQAGQGVMVPGVAR